MNRLLAIDAQVRLNHWHGANLAVDGRWGPRSQAALVAAGGMPALRRHPSGLLRIVLHWSAGHHAVSALDRQHYHSITDGEGNRHWGGVRCEANARVAGGPYAAHTRNLNNASIGMAVAAMAGAVERPFSAGDAPITRPQAAAFIRHVAETAAAYSIPITAWSILSHAEVQPTLGVVQRGKWDIAWWPGMTAPADPCEVGNRLRARIAEEVAA